jgi:hypothetical protein
MLVVHVTLDMKVAIHANGPVIRKLEKAATLVHEPEFTIGYCGWHLIIRKASSNDDALFHVAFLGNEKHLITRVGWAGHSPPVSDPL